MQALSFSASVAQVAVSAAAPKRTVQAKATPVVAAAGRREALKLAASTVLLAASPALAASVAQDYQIIDDRKAKKNGFDLIYEARDLDVTNEAAPGDSTRFALQKLSPADAKKRVATSVTRVKTAVPPLIAKEYYPVAQRELRTVVGYLRFDLKELAELSGSKKANLALVATAKADLEALDFQLRSKNLAGSQAAFTKAVASLEVAQKAVA